MSLNTSLIELGFSDIEAKVYLAALTLGQSSAQDLAKKAGLHRTYFYDLAKRMLARDILRQAKVGKRKCFCATPPDVLFRQQQKKLDDLGHLIPQLNAIHNTRGEKPKVYYFDGVDGVKTMYDDILATGVNYVGFGTPNYATKDDGGIIAKYIKDRVAADIHTRYIGEVCPAILAGVKRNVAELRETRLFSTNLFHSEVEMNIYGNKVAVLNLKSKFGVIIEDRDIADVVKQIFELVWKSKEVIK